MLSRVQSAVIRGPLLLTLFCVLFTVAVAPAMAERGTPGSLLILPEYDHRPGTTTLLTVTNAHASLGVVLEFTYVSEAGCSRSTVQETLAPKDTLTLLTSAHTGEFERGYVYVHARNNESPIKFDWLIGQATVIHGLELENFQYSVEAFAFRAGPELVEGQDTDIDNDGLLDHDGVEYEMIADRLLLPRFLGQTARQLQSELILINLTGAVQFDATIVLKVFNDDSSQFQEAHSFRCWERVPLSSISVIFDNGFLANSTPDDPFEIFGLNSQESGWFAIDGELASSERQTIQDPAILAALIVMDDNTSSSALLPFVDGVQPNGALLQTGASIDRPPGFVVCVGDGSGAVCPCANFGGSDEGCRNSRTRGAKLAGTGTQSIALDNLRLVVSQAPPNASGFYLQGGTLVGVPFGDGLLCVGQPTRRLQFRQTDLLGNALSDLSLAGFVNSGDTVYYQFWFREPGSAGPCGNASNLSNAYRVSWN